MRKQAHSYKNAVNIQSLQRVFSPTAAVALPKVHTGFCLTPYTGYYCRCSCKPAVKVCCPAMSTSPFSSVVSLAIFLFILHPTFSSSSCTSQLKCNGADPTEVTPPFFVGSPGLDPACRKSINVSCGQLGPELDLAIEDTKLLLKEIQYDSHTVVVQDVGLSVLKNLSCSFFFTFRLQAACGQLPEQLPKLGEVVLVNQLRPQQRHSFPYL